MKKILTLGIVALVLITMSSCQFNLFAEFDKIEIPSVADLNAKATSDEEGFVSDVEDYVENDFLENDDVTDAQVDAIVLNLETIYGGSGSTETVQQAAVLAGEIIINRDPVTSSVVNGVIGTVSEAISSGATIDPDTIVANIFPKDLSLSGLTAILDNLSRAADAYNDFAVTVSGGGTADWMTSGEVGDMALFAVVAIAITDIRNQGGVSDQNIYDLIKDGTPSLTATNPFDLNVNLQDILIFADLPL